MRQLLAGNLRLIPVVTAAILLAWIVLPLARPILALQTATDPTDNTLRAMQDEMARSKDRLVAPPLDKPYYIEYRLLDLDIRTVRSSFGALISTDTTRTRFMEVNVRVGNYHLDSSNFIGQGGFQGFLGNTGQVGIDRDYNSLRQDLWLATDQAYKEALEQLAQKTGFLRSLAKPPEIDDFSKELPLQMIEPRVNPDWTSRNWEDESSQASGALRNFPDLNASRVNYYMIYANYYMLNSEGTEIRIPSNVAAIEASMETRADDGMPLHNFYTTYVPTPAQLPSASVVADSLSKAGQDLMDMRSAPLMQDYVGPVLFDAPAAAALLAQVLEPSLSGARQPLSMLSVYDDRMSRLGGRSEWSGRLGSRVLPAGVSLTDDPAVAGFHGSPVIGGYSVDAEGVRAQKVEIVENGMLRNLLMSRRPGPDFSDSNGHARSALLSDPRPDSSVLTFQSADALNPEALNKKFLETCAADGQKWCLEVRAMDNPAISAMSQDDFEELVANFAGGISNGDRQPLRVYQVDAATGKKQLVRGGWLTGLNLRSLRNAPAVGDDLAAFNYMRNVSFGFSGTSLGAFGSAQNGLPSTVIAPSLLLEDVETRGFHGEPRRTELLPPPPLK